VKRDLFDAEFNEQKFREFVVKLLPDFVEERRPIVADGILKNVRMLGTSEGCRLTVLIVRVGIGESEKRIAITQAAFRILRQHRIRNALVVFYANKPNWRLSLLTSTLKIENGKVVNRTSSPRRFSYLLGPKAKAQTPRKFLLEQGQVTSLKELQERFSVEVVNKEFYRAIQTQFLKLVGGEQGAGRAHKIYTPQLNLPSDQREERSGFAVRLIGRVMFCWFLKEKASDDGKNLMPESLMSLNAVRRHPNYYHNVLEPVFFGCLNTKFEQREVRLKQAPFEQIPYLNGGLFNPQTSDYAGRDDLEIDDEWFEELFEILSQYNFTVDENTSQDADLSIDPEMLGRIFENLLAEINPETGESARKATGSFYTPREIVAYMVDAALGGFLKREAKIADEKIASLLKYDGTEELTLENEDRKAIVQALTRLKILDPACGSGAFPVGILQKVFYILQRVDADGQMWYETQKSKWTADENADDWRAKIEDGNLDYLRKLGIIQQSIFGVDVQPIATEIAKLRCFLILVIEEKVDDTKPNRGIHPLPNLDFKFVTANTLKYLPENPNDPFNMFENGRAVELVKQIQQDYFLADKTGRAFLKAEFNEAQTEISATKQELAAARYQNLANWQPFVNQQTGWFDSVWMFGVKEFDIVIGNPPYGAMLTKSTQKYCLEHYKTAKSEGELKGSLDTFALFIERGLEMLKTGGSLVYVVPMAITSNDAMTMLQNELEQQCETIRIASFANRPRQIFDNACVRTSIICCEKTNSMIKNLYMTRPMRRGKNESIQEVIERLEFVEASKLKLYGRYPKVGSQREVEILEKIFQTRKCVQDYADENSEEAFYYRAAGGRYFNIVTLTETETSAERKYRTQHATLIAACLSTSLFWFYQQVYTDGLNLKGYEVDKFPLPNFEKVEAEVLRKIEALYLRYLEEVEANANTKKVAGNSRYNIQQFKEYKLAKSKKLIDAMDDLIDPLYGLNAEEVEYVKKYEEEVRGGGENGTPDRKLDFLLENPDRGASLRKT